MAKLRRSGARRPAFFSVNSERIQPAGSSRLCIRLISLGLLVAMTAWAADVHAQRAPVATAHAALQHDDAEEFYCATRYPTRPVESLRVEPELGPQRRSADVLRAPPASAVTGPCTAAEFAALSGSAFASAIAASHFSCIGELWSMSGGAGASMTSTNVSAVAAAIVAATPDLVVNAEPIRNLLHYYEIAFFNEYYYEEVQFSAAATSAAQQALIGVGRSRLFMDSSFDVSWLRMQWTDSVESMTALHLVLDEARAILQQAVSAPEKLDDMTKRRAVSRLLRSLGRQIRYFEIVEPDANPWPGLLDAGFVGLIGALAAHTQYTEYTDYVGKAAIAALGALASLGAPVAGAAHTALSDAFRLQPRYSALWLTAVLELADHYNGRLDNGIDLDLDTLRVEMLDHAMPNVFEFDGGAVTLRMAGDAGQAQLLYDAMQEVKSQFFRMTGWLDPVSDDPNARMILYIYGNRDDYVAYQPFIFDLPTQNGGLYLEAEGSLFTYDRPDTDPVADLEELVRHEYAHYLAGRYLFPGVLGEPGTLFGAGLTLWYEEGLAEYLVGSTRSLGVLPRGKLLARIAEDPVRMTVSEIIAAGYFSGFTFYRYAGMLFAFLREREPGLLLELLEAGRGGHIPTLSAIYDAIDAEPSLTSAYHSFLSAKQQQWQGGTGLFAEEVDTVRASSPLPVNNSGQLFSDLAAAVPAERLDFVTWPGRFRLAATVAAEAGMSAVGLRGLLDADADAYLTALEPAAMNFAAAVAWFGVDRPNPGADVTLVIEGPYSGSTTHPEPPPLAGGGLAGDINRDGQVTIADAMFVLQAAAGAAVCEACRCDVDGSGAVTITDALKVLKRAIGATTDLVAPTC